MKRYRPLLAAFVALVFYSITDILVWQRIFESNQLVEYADAYHLGWFFSLAGYAAVGVVILAEHWRDCVFYLATLFVGAFSGLEDVLYYFLDGRPLPAALPWLQGNPLIIDTSRAGVIGSVVFWLLALTLLYAVVFHSWRGPNSAQWRTARGSSLSSARRRHRVSSEQGQSKNPGAGKRARAQFAPSSANKSSA